MSSMIGANISVDKIRQEIEKNIERGQRFSVGIEVPLSTGSRRVLKFAGEEADRFAQRHVGTEHMLLALLREKNARAAAVLRQCGAREAEIRLKLAGNASPYREATQLADGTLFYRIPSPPIGSAILTLNSFLVGLKNNTSPELAIFSGKCGSVRKRSRKSSRDCSRPLPRKIRPIALRKLFLSAPRRRWHPSFGRTRCIRIRRPGPCCE